MSSLIILGGITVIFALYVSMERLHVAPTPTLPAVRKAALELMNGLNPKHIAELGSGWGGMMTRLSKTFPNAKVTGYERSFIPYIVSKLMGHDVRRTDLFAADLGNVDLVFCYLSPWHMERLQFKPGTTIVSASFPIPNKTPSDTRIVKGIVDIPVYLYRF